jgi:hypothetical protein
LLRSVGGWAALKGFRDIGVRIKGEERLLGSSDFVERVLKQANEQLEEKYRLQVSVTSLQALIEKVAHYHKIDPVNLKSANKERPVTEARRLSVISRYVNWDINVPMFPKQWASVRLR